MNHPHVGFSYFSWTSSNWVAPFFISPLLFGLPHFYWSLTHLGHHHFYKHSTLCLRIFSQAPPTWVGGVARIDHLSRLIITETELNYFEAKNDKDEWFNQKG